MKHGLKPSVKQMKYIGEVLGLDPKEWLVVKWNPGIEVVLESRADGSMRRFEG